MTTVPTRSQAPSIVPAGAAAARAQVRPAAGGGITGKDVIRILRKRKVMITVSVGITLVITVVATLLWALYAPFYTADALLAVNPPRRAGLSSDTYLPGGEIMDRLLASTAQIAMSRPVMESALLDPDLRHTPWYVKDPNSALRRLQEEIKIAPVAKTNYIRVSMTGRDPKQLPVIVNAMAKAAVNEKTKHTKGRVNVDIRQLQTELTELGKSLAEARQKTGKIAPEDRPEPVKIAELQRKIEALRSKLSLLHGKMAELEMLRSQTISAWEAIKDMEPEQIAQLPDVQIPVQSDPILARLRNERMGLEAERQNAERRLGEKHLMVQSLRARIVNLDKQIEDRTQELTSIQVMMIQRERQKNPAIVAQQLLLVNTEVRRMDKEQEDAVRELEQQKLKYDAIKEAQALQRQQVDREVLALLDRKGRIERRLDELRVEAGSLEAIELDRHAFPPDRPSWPKWEVMIPLGLIVGLAVGLGLAFLLELVDTSIRAPSDVSRRVDLPLLGMIPHTDDLEDEVEDMRLAFMTAPNSIITEAFRQIRTTLMFSGPASKRRSMLITSPLPGDGRTSVAMNLAGCIARSGHKVLVVDANFRQPTISDLFPRAPKAGFSSALVGQANWREQIHEVEENLYVLLAGPLPPNPAELLGSEQMRKIVQEMEAEYDQVIFDGAPSVVVTDSSVLSTEIDAVILVVRAGANTYGIVQRTRDILNRVGAHLLGVVLNGVRVTSGGYLRKNYETYYQYHQQPQLTAAGQEGEGAASTEPAAP